MVIMGSSKIITAILVLLPLCCNGFVNHAAHTAHKSTRLHAVTEEEPKTKQKTTRYTPKKSWRNSNPAEIGNSVKAASQQMQEMRKSMEEDEQVRVLMQGLRGANINDDNTAAEGLEMLVVEVDEDETNSMSNLPKTYEPEVLKAFFDARPALVYKRLLQIFGSAGPLISALALDAATNKLEENQVKRASQFREIITSLGPFFIKLGQALSIRPDILAPPVMVEMQKLCDKVPSYDSKRAFATIEKELGKPVSELFSEITPEPIAAASLGQVYRAKLAENGEEVAVKVQRPFVLETVSLDLYLIRELGYRLREIPFLAERTDLVALIDEFAPRFYDELDYNQECENGVRIREYMASLPMVVVPKNYPDYTSRRVFTAEWIEGEKLSQSTADDVGDLVNVGVVAYLSQLLESGFFHADPHPGNLIRTPDGRLCLLDFGLMTEVTDDQKYGMIEAIAHLIHRDYSQIGEDFKKLDFIPKDVDVDPIVPALTRVFDAALEGGGAKSINFQELAADLAQITFEYPFRIPPYFALVIRAIGVLEGIALVANPGFAIVDEAYPYIAQRLLKDESPRLREALRYMVYGQSNVFDVERMVDLLQAFESFSVVSAEAGGYGIMMGFEEGTVMANKKLSSTRDALTFLFSPAGEFFREFLLDEVVRAVDCLSRQGLREVASIVGIRGSLVPPVFRAMAPKLSDEEARAVDNIRILLNFFSGELAVAGAPSGTESSQSRLPFAIPGRLFTRLARQDDSALGVALGSASNLANNPEQARELQAIIRELGPQMRDFGFQVSRRVAQVATRRLLEYAADRVLGPVPAKKTEEAPIA